MMRGYAMRNETIASSEDNRTAQDYGTPTLAGTAATEAPITEETASQAPLASAAWAGDFPADFTDEEKFFMLDVAAFFPSEREFVALLGGDAAAVWDAEPDDEADQQPSLEQRTISSVFARLNLPALTTEPRK